VKLLRQVDAGGAEIEEQAGCLVDVRLIEAGDVQCGEPMAEEAGEEGRVQGFEFGGDAQVAFGSDGSVGLHPLPGDLVEAGLVACGMGGESDQGGGDIAVEGLIQAREDVVAEAVAAMGGGGVGGIVAEAQAMGGDVGVDFGAPPGEERAVKDEAVVELLEGFHAGETGEAGASAGVGEHGLSLVLGMMGEEDMRRVVFGGGLQEKGVAGLAGGGFERQAVFGGESGDIGFGDLAGEAEGLGEVADEAGIEAGVATAEAVVEVADDEVGAALSEEPVKENDGVAATGDGDEEIQVFRIKFQEGRA
jgi:hypothetical protein